MHLKQSETSYIGTLYYSNSQSQTPYHYKLGMYLKQSTHIGTLE